MSRGRPVAYLPHAGAAEDRLVEGLRRGEGAAYRQLYELHAPRLLRTLGRIFRDEQLAQDAVQATFLAVFRSVHRFDGRSALLTWMTRIAIREGQRIAQGQARARRLRDGGEAADTLTDRDRHADRQQYRLLEGLIAALPLEKRAALLLFEVEGFSVQEIADITGEPRGTVLARLSRTRAELREAMNQAVADSAPLPQKRKHHG